MFSFREIRLALLYMVLTASVVVGVLAIPFHYWAQDTKQIAEADTPRPAVDFPKVQVYVDGKRKEMTVEKLLFHYLRSQGRSGSGPSVQAISAPTGC